MISAFFHGCLQTSISSKYHVENDLDLLTGLYMSASTNPCLHNSPLHERRIWMFADEWSDWLIRSYYPIELASSDGPS